MSSNNRDEFSPRTKIQLAKRAGWLCSDPSCRRPTVGSNSNGDGEIMTGVAAHICAAAPDGPRYDFNMTQEQRKSVDNGIWLCQLHGKSVDANDSAFTVELLHKWRALAQETSMRNVLYNDVPHGPIVQELSEDELGARLRAAAARDIDVFRRSDKWPATPIALTLKINGKNDPVSTSALATILATLDDLVLVAPPGMGKTTTLFQIAEAILANGSSSPIMIPLGDWSTDGVSLIESILKRSAFQEISEKDLRVVAAKAGVIFLLDGWNELDIASRRRAAVEVKRLQLELPELSLLISTRKQALDVPVDGTRINLLPLNEEQQVAISFALRGEAGERILELAWRSLGVRELVTTPLYLTALLTLPEGEPFPTTKEELLRRFVASHEMDNQRIDELTQVTKGFYRRFLEDLAVHATHAANTTLTETAARKSVSETVDALVSEGQITNKPDTDTVLDVLVNFHVLMRSGNPSGYSFHHQQFQEWYASHFVEQLILASLDCDNSCETLRANVFNQPAWEEAILFACERLSRGSQQKQDACGAAILAAFTVDPILASDMISRSTDDVWKCVGSHIVQFIEKWHAPGKVDRALSFMISSGRVEFFGQVWPLITHENDQVQLAALGASKRFRASLIGNNAAKLILALPLKIRENILLEIAHNGDIDDLDLAVAIVKADPSSEIKAKVVEVFWFRRFDRHFFDVLQDADSKTFDFLVRQDDIHSVKDEKVKSGLAAARKRVVDPYRKMYFLVYGSSDVDYSAELVAFIAEMQIENNQEGALNLIHQAQKRFPHAVAEGILHRVRKNLMLPFRSSELMVGSNFVLEDNALYEIAIAAGNYNNRANAATSALGPLAVGRMIKALFDLKKLIRGEDGIYDSAVCHRYDVMKNRFGFTQTATFLAAISSKASETDTEEISELADLIALHLHEKSDRGQTIDESALETITKFVEDWGLKLSDSADVTRSQMASVVKLTSYLSSPNLLPVLKCLLDKELYLWSGFKALARSQQFREGTAKNEAAMSWMLQYQRAFLVNDSPETMRLMCQYLSKEDFGYHAALVLANKWRVAHEPNDRKQWQIGRDFSRVAAKRAARAVDPTESSAEADAIFDAVELLINADVTESTQKLVFDIASVAVALPHGQRGDLIKTILAFGNVHSRGEFLSNLALSGEIIDVELVKQGISNVFDEAKHKPWILTDGYNLQNWIQLLPFVNNPVHSLEIMRTLPEQYQSPQVLEDLIAAFKFASSDEAESVLFQLAESNHSLYGNHSWRKVVLSLGTLSAAKRFVDLIVKGTFDKSPDIGGWHNSKSLANLIGDFAELRALVYDFLKNGPSAPGFNFLVQAVVENPDENGLLLLIQLEIEHKQRFASWYTIRSVVIDRVPVDDWIGAYSELALPAIELRRKLLAMTTDGGPADSAARCLRQIDKLRYENGSPESEPRHPNLASKRPWPIMTHDPDASETG